MVWQTPRQHPVAYPLDTAEQSEVVEQAKGQEPITEQTLLQHRGVCVSEQSALLEQMFGQTNSAITH